MARFSCGCRILGVMMFSLIFIPSALAGGLVVLKDTVDLRGSVNDTFRPSQIISISFRAHDYEYGSSEFKYGFFAIAPAEKKLSEVKDSDVRGWEIYAALMKRPDDFEFRQQELGPSSEIFRGSQYEREEITKEENERGMRFSFQFYAPTRPGRYKFVYHRVPWFTSAPMRTSHRLRELSLVNGRDRDVFIASVLAQGRSFGKVIEFTVAADTPKEPNLTVYLRVNGSAPTYAPVKGGLSEKPMVFTWHVGPEFKQPHDKVMFRYQLWPDESQWTEWSTDQEAKYFFLPKGSHELRVQARYKDKEYEIQSNQARFEFILNENFVAKPSKEALTKGADSKQFPGITDRVKPNISFSDVYASSRALVIGLWNFDDKRHFAQFGQSKIEKDVNKVSNALAKNGFTTKVIFRERLTKEEILSEIETLVNNSKSKDRLFIYFSSHGFADKHRPADGYIATSDCEYDKPFVRCLRVGDLDIQARRALEGPKVRQVFIAIDSCFAGLGVVTKAAGTPNLAKLASPQGVFMMTAGMADQTAQIDPVLQMSTFSHYLAEGLSGKADIFGNGVISSTALHLYVQYEVARRTNSRQIPMLGRVFGDGEMLFKPAIDSNSISE